MVRVGIAIEKDEGLDSKIADRFGRAPYFLIIEYEEGKIKDHKIIKNPGAESQSGAGAKSVETLLHQDVKIAVGPNFGPNARAIMQELGIQPIMIPAGTKVKEALKEIEQLLSK